MKSSLEIAQGVKLKPISKIAKKIGLKENDLDLYGPNIAKLSAAATKRVLASKKKDGKLILVTAITPTRAGEGKTTTTIGLGQALERIGKKSIICLRQPSMGPIFGVKGGATGGGLSQVLPMEDINLHFTGDIHAVSAADNLLASIIDNYLYYNHKSPAAMTITWKRALDVNDRSLRNIQICLKGNLCIPRSESFQITAASEVMAVLCLSKSIADLRDNLGKIIVGFDESGKPLSAHDLNANGAMAAILHKAIQPNLVQSIEGTPAFIHGGPFANIAHGCSSLIATSAALKLADFVVTEAGFGSDLGMEKFFDIKCRTANLRPNAVVLVVTCRALRSHGGAKDYSSKNIDALKKGLPNLGKHIENIGKFGVPCVVSLNHFDNDGADELDEVKKFCDSKGVKLFVADVFSKGGRGAVQLAKEVVKIVKQKNNFRFLYSLKLHVKEKIGLIAREMYGAAGVNYTEEAEKDIVLLEKNGLGGLPVCISKTQASLTDDPKIVGRPEGFRITVREVYASSGAGFLVALSGELISMPGLPEHPNAYNITVDDNGKIKGLF